MAVTLNRPEVAKKYEATVDKDVTIHARGYSGKLSNINEEGAKHCIESKAPFLKEKKEKPNSTDPK
ncbi:MAG TPA: hypothetical protein VFS22_10175 [Flavisolibacter sp.]|nr:hypothetical protein [Flavisolibacter sp.]